MSNWCSPALTEKRHRWALMDTFADVDLQLEANGKPLPRLLKAQNEARPDDE